MLSAAIETFAICVLLIHVAPVLNGKNEDENFEKPMEKLEQLPFNSENDHGKKHNEQLGTKVHKNQEVKLGDQLPNTQLKNGIKIVEKEKRKTDPKENASVPMTSLQTRDLKNPICDCLSKTKTFLSMSLTRMSFHFGKSTPGQGKQPLKTSPSGEGTSFFERNTSLLREKTPFSGVKTSGGGTSSFEQKTSPPREKAPNTSPLQGETSPFGRATSLTSPIREKPALLRKETPSDSSEDSVSIPPPRKSSIFRRLKSSKRKEEGFSLAANIKNINIIPGVGEFVYDTIIQHIRTTNGPARSINHNNDSKQSDAMVSLDQLKKELPNIEWVSVVVNWFANDINIKDCRIYPAVEFQDNFWVEPEDWQVGRTKRENARMVKKDKDGNRRHRGTVSDGALIRYIDELHRRGYKVMLHPMLLLDTENQEWRGEITGSTLFVDNFFHNGYNNFIKHYANIAKHTKVEAFVIGSELEGLTTIKDVHDNYPAVLELVYLARYVKRELGRDVTVTYAANWSEYHSRNGWYFMDELWASEYIDVVGIDAYFPLTDGPEPPGGYTVQDIVKAWDTGEGFDYYLDDPVKSRPEKLKYTETRWAWKNIDKWWGEVHVNPDGKQTNWRPKMKNIWFIEYGFASVDACTNEPYVFTDVSNEGQYPRYSNKAVSFRSQKVAIEGTLKKWGNSAVVEKMFLWAWDARPYPYFPNYQELWSDAVNWPKCHCVQGKIGKTMESKRKTVKIGRTGFVSFKKSSSGSDSP